MTLEELILKEDKFKYQILSRLRMDCDYYLGAGGRNAGALWAKNEQKQIEYMKGIYNSFKEGYKPEWISLDDINKYEKEMVG